MSVSDVAGAVGRGVVNAVSRFFPGGSARDVEEGMKEFLTSFVEVGDCIQLGRHEILVLSANEDEELFVRSGMQYYAVDINVIATRIKMEKNGEEEK